MSLSQFDSPAELLSGGARVRVSGPVTRAPDELDDIEFVVLVQQDGAVARGRCWARNNAGTWQTELDVQGGTFRPGPAIASALSLTEVQKPPSIATQTWSEQIELVEVGASPR